MPTFKLGRNRPALNARRLRFSDYVSPSLPVPPQVEHWAPTAKAWNCLENVYANDTLGDCVEAGGAHLIGLWRGAAGSGGPYPTVDQVVAVYSAATGYVPGDPATDQGTDEVSFLNWWKQNGYFPDAATRG
jgi:hypothetical protein